MITTEVTELITALRHGSLTLEEVAQRFRERSWPRTRKPEPASYLEMAAAATGPAGGSGNVREARFGDDGEEIWAGFCLRPD